MTTRRFTWWQGALLAFAISGCHYSFRAGTFPPDHISTIAVQPFDNETNRFEIYVRSYPDLGGKRKVSTDGGVAPLWNPDGGELFYSRENKLFSVSIQTEPDFSAAEPELLLEGPYHFYTAQSGEGSEYDISPIDGRFLVLRTETVTQSASAGRSMVFVENWFEEVRRLAPRAE